VFSSRFDGRGAHTLKIHNSLTDAAAGGLMLLTIVSSAYGQRRWDAPPIVTSYCSGCHGIDGNTQLPYFPKLAGIDATYAEKKLAAFREVSPPTDELFSEILKLSGANKGGGNVSRQERINMEGVAHAAKPEVIRQAVEWYAKQPRAPGRSGNKALIAQGRERFMNGLPAQKVIACKTCHGTDAQGKGPAPSLAGQNAEYIESQLTKFREGDRRHAPEMTIVTRDLDPEQARAVAVYLQSL
jgi:cytochrome c553